MSSNAIFDAALEEIEEFYGLTPRLNDDNSTMQSQVGIFALNDPDLADVFSYLDKHASSKTATATSNPTTRSGSTQNDASLLRLRNRPDLVEPVIAAGQLNHDDDVNKVIS